MLMKINPFKKSDIGLIFRKFRRKMRKTRAPKVGMMSSFGIPGMYSEQRIPKIKNRTYLSMGNGIQAKPDIITSLSWFYVKCRIPQIFLLRFQNQI